MSGERYLADRDYNKNGLDLFRVIATIQVFLGHFTTHFGITWLPVDLVYFVRGVPILFVLCGFLAAKSIEKYTAKEWLLRRMVRILPGFWACILINSVIIAVIYGTKPTAVQGIVYLVTQLFGMNFYTGDWLRGYGVGTPNGVLWTIPVQLQFFLLVPLLAKYLKKSSARGACGCVCLLALLSTLLEKCSSMLPSIVSKLIGVTVFPYLYFLVAGMVGWYHRDAIIPALRKKKWWLLAAYAAWRVAEIFLRFPLLFDGVMYNAVDTLLLAALIFGFAFDFTWRMPRDYTYGFYLYHMVYINIVVHFGIRQFTSVWQAAAVLAAVVVLTVLSAWLSQKYIEDPAAKWMSKEIKKHG